MCENEILFISPSMKTKCCLVFLQNGSNVSGSKFRLPSFGFGQKHDANVDIPLDAMNVIKLLVLTSWFLFMPKEKVVKDIVL